jgi:hypothetical protein
MDRTGQEGTTGEDRTGQDRTGHDRAGQDRTGRDRTGQDRTGQNGTERDKKGQDRTRQENLQTQFLSHSHVGIQKIRMPIYFTAEVSRSFSSFVILWLNVEEFTEHVSFLT